SSFAGVVSLYNEDPDAVQLLFDTGGMVGPTDPYNPLGYRQLEQSAGPGAAVTRDLGPGRYYVAVSGAGNQAFHPLLADSGYEGSPGDYALTPPADGLPPSPSPAVLLTELRPGVTVTDPTQLTTIDRSPAVLRVEFSGDIPSASCVPGTT